MRITTIKLFFGIIAAVILFNLAAHSALAASVGVDVVPDEFEDSTNVEFIQLTNELFGGIELVNINELNDIADVQELFPEFKEVQESQERTTEEKDELAELDDEGILANIRKELLDEETDIDIEDDQKAEPENPENVFLPAPAKENLVKEKEIEIVVEEPIVENSIVKEIEEDTVDITETPIQIDEPEAVVEIEEIEIIGVSTEDIAETKSDLSFSKDKSEKIEIVLKRVGDYLEKQEYEFGNTKRLPKKTGKRIQDLLKEDRDYVAEQVSKLSESKRKKDRKKIRKEVREYIKDRAASRNSIVINEVILPKRDDVFEKTDELTDSYDDILERLELASIDTASLRTLFDELTSVISAAKETSSSLENVQNFSDLQELKSQLKLIQELGSEFNNQVQMLVLEVTK